MVCSCRWKIVWLLALNLICKQPTGNLQKLSEFWGHQFHVNIFLTTIPCEHGIKGDYLCWILLPTTWAQKVEHEKLN